MSTYITSREPNKYGGKQESYCEQVDGIVRKTVGNFQQAAEKNEDWEEVFYKTFAVFGEERNRIAKEHATNRADYFGIPRDGDHSFGTFIMTALTDSYQEYNDKLLPLFQKHLSTMKHTKTEFIQTSLKVEEKLCLGKAFSWEYEILTDRFLAQWLRMPTVEEFQRLGKLCGVPDANLPTIESGPLNFNFFLNNKTYMQTLKANYPEDYKRLKLVHTIHNIRTRYPADKKSDWILVTARVQIDKKMYALSQYLTWAYRDFKDDPVEHMTGRSIISVLHQDIFLIKPTLKDIAQIFKRAMQHDRNDEKGLQELQALFQFMFAQAMPSIRGTAAESEWFERAMYEYQGYTLQYNPNKMVNLEALTSSLGEFVANYPQLVSLKKLQNG